MTENRNPQPPSQSPLPRKLEERFAFGDELVRRMEGLLDQASGFGESGTTSTAEAPSSLTLEDLERTMRDLDPTGRRTVTTLIDVDLEKLPVGTLRMLFSVVRSMANWEAKKESDAGDRQGPR